MTEGKIYEFTRSQVNEARTSYKSVPRGYLLRFNGDTTIKLKEENPKIPKYYFNFLKFESIGDAIKDPEAVVDIIGQLKIINGVREYQKSKRLIRLREIELQNERGNSMEITLWGDNIELFDESKFPQSGTSQQTIVIFSSLQVHEYNEYYSLKTYSGTKVFFCETLPEITAFKKICQPCSIISNPTGHGRFSGGSYANAPSVTLRELLSNYASIETAQNVRCIATLAGFDHPEGWYYIGCTNDQTKLKQSANRFRCENYNLWFDEPAYCFRLVAFITDEDGQEADVVLFDKQAQALCGYNVTYLVSQPDTSRHEVPYVFAPFVGQKYNFVLKYNRGTEQNKCPTFNVNDMVPMTNPAFIEEHSPEDSGSSAVTMPAAGTGATRLSASQSNLPPKTPSKVSDSKKNESSRGKGITSER